MPFDYPGYGATGIAVGNLDADAAGTQEIVVTTLNGEMTVFRWQAGALVPLQYLRLEGGVGVFGSIVAADLSPSNGAKMEICVATTQGIRRFDVQ